MKGMTSIVRDVVGLISPFVLLYSAYVVCTGHLSPGGGFAGGVMLMAGVAMVIMAFGGDRGKQLKATNRCHVLDALGALAFAALALLGLATGGFFVNFLPPGRVHDFLSGGTILLANVAIGLKVAAGLTGIFLALVLGCRQAMFKNIAGTGAYTGNSQE